MPTTDTIRDVLAEATGALSLAMIGEARFEAALLLTHVINRGRSFIIAHPEYRLATTELHRFREFIARRVAGEPTQYITGHQEFFGLDFRVTPDVLIPRPETEIIIEAALEVSSRGSIVISDIGTGSGCLIVTLLCELPHAIGVAIDTSFAALRVAENNAKTHRVIDRLSLIQADAFSVFATQQLSVIVSNPPYVSSSDYDALPREVRAHEPVSALVSGLDGLSHIRSYLREALRALLPGGYFVFEIGFGQHEAVKELIDPTLWTVVEVRNDLQNIPRAFTLQKR